MYCMWLNHNIIMDNYNSIQQIPIESILNILKIQYRKNGVCLHLLQDWKVTDWRIGNLSDNYINDFVWKDRPKWPPFAFVRKYLNLNDKETFKWFEDRFGIRNPGGLTYSKQKGDKRTIKNHPQYTSNW